MPEALRVLLMEDNPGDAQLVAVALRDNDHAAELHVTSNGRDALAFLRREGPYAAAPRPDVVLLDLAVPRVDGRQVLAALKADPGLRRLPVIVLTSSAAERDVLDAYDLHANAYVTKPPELQAFLEAVGSVIRFFTTVATLPAR